MQRIIGKFKGRKIRAPEFHKNGKLNTNFDYYKQFVNKDENFDLNYFKGENIGKTIARYSITRLKLVTT